MSAKPKKVVKLVLWTLAGIVGFVLFALLTIPLWIGPVGTSVANSVVPELTGTAFNLGEFALNPYSGRVHLGKIVLQNPADETSESEPNALTLESVDVLMDTTSLLSDTIVIHGSVTMADHTSPIDAETPTSPAPLLPDTSLARGVMSRS